MVGSQFGAGVGVYCIGDAYFRMAYNYSREAPDLMFWRCVWELEVDRGRLTPCNIDHQWIQ